MTGRRKIFDGDHIYVIFDEIASDSVVFTFSGLEAMDLRMPEFGDGFVQKCGHSGVFFVSKHSHWWQTSEFDKAIDAANKATAHIRVRTSYGHSMGGYGALLSAGCLNSRALVTAPQTTLLTEIAPMNPKWLSAMAGFERIRDNVNEEISRSPGATIFYDPRFRTDALHFKHIERNPLVSTYILPFGTHYIPRCLKEMGIFSHIMRAMLADPRYPVKIARELMRNSRLKSPIYVTALSRKLSRRRSKWLSSLAARIIERQISENLNSGLLSDHLELALSEIRR